MNANAQNWVPGTPAALTSYAIMTWMSGAFMLGFVDASASYFAGIVAIVAFIPLFVTGVTSLRMGDLVGGNTFLYFSAFFALGTGLCWLAQFFAGIYGWAYDMRILGWEWLILATVLTLTTPAFKRPRTVLVSISIVDVALYISALLYLGVLGAAAAYIGGVLYFIAGLLAFYTAAAVMLGSVGIKLPIGA